MSRSFLWTYNLSRFLNKSQIFISLRATVWNLINLFLFFLLKNLKQYHRYYTHHQNYFQHSCFQTLALVRIGKNNLEMVFHWTASSLIKIMKYFGRWTHEEYLPGWRLKNSPRNDDPDLINVTIIMIFRRGFWCLWTSDAEISLCWIEATPVKSKAFKS